jgi:predicted AAA+ superfamily ATPase
MMNVWSRHLWITWSDVMRSRRSHALADTRVVLVNGARQSGKSTLVRQLAKAGDTEWRDLDDPLTRQAALSDPSGFVDFPERMVIDEIHRAPELLLAIKSQVDADQGPAGIYSPAPPASRAAWAT